MVPILVSTTKAVVLDVVPFTLALVTPPMFATEIATLAEFSHVEDQV